MFILPTHSFALLPAPPRNIKSPKTGSFASTFPAAAPSPTTRQEPGKLHTNQPPSAPTPSERTTGHVAEGGTIIESVLRPPREDSEVPWSRRGPFRPGRPRFCPSGGRAPAAPPQPVRESAAARAPAPGPCLPRPSLSGRVLAAPRASGGIWGEASPLPLRTSGGTFRGSGAEGGPQAGRGVWGVPLEQTGFSVGPTVAVRAARAGLGVPGVRRQAGAWLLSFLYCSLLSRAGREPWTRAL